MYIVVSVDNVTMYQVLCQHKPLLFKQRGSVIGKWNGHRSDIERMFLFASVPQTCICLAGDLAKPLSG